MDFYKESSDLTDLEISVSVNGTRKTLTTDYTLVDGTKNKYVKYLKEYIYAMPVLLNIGLF